MISNKQQSVARQPPAALPASSRRVSVSGAQWTRGIVVICFTVCGVCGRDHVGSGLRCRGQELSERPDARVARPAGWRAARGPDEVLALRRVAHVLLLQLLRVGRAGAAGRSERQGP